MRHNEGISELKEKSIYSYLDSIEVTEDKKDEILDGIRRVCNDTDYRVFFEDVILFGGKKIIKFLVRKYVNAKSSGGLEYTRKFDTHIKYPIKE